MSQENVEIVQATHLVGRQAGVRVDQDGSARAVEDAREQRVDQYRSFHAHRLDHRQSPQR
jgi:hypothetical protein